MLTAKSGEVVLDFPAELGLDDVIVEFLADSYRLEFFDFFLRAFRIFGFVLIRDE